MKPSIGRIVHYVSYGTPGGEFKSECRAAIVTAVHPGAPHIDVDRVTLAVLNPTGMFFNEQVRQAEHGDTRGGTWHWPEREEED